MTEIVSKQAGGFGVRTPRGSKGVFIKSMTIRTNAGRTHIDYEGSPIDLEVTAPHVKLERVYDRGQWYNPPRQHLNAPLDACDSLTVAELALNYCRAMVMEAEATISRPA